MLDAAGLEEGVATWLADATTITMQIVSPHPLIRQDFLNRCQALSAEAMNLSRWSRHVAIVALDLLLK